MQFFEAPGPKGRSVIQVGPEDAPEVAQLAMQFQQDGDYRTSRDLGTLAISLYQQAGHGNCSVVGSLYTTIAIASSLLGEFPRAREALDRARNVLTNLEPPQPILALSNIIDRAVVERRAGDKDVSDRCIDEFLSLMSETTIPNWQQLFTSLLHVGEEFRDTWNDPEVGVKLCTGCAEMAERQGLVVGMGELTTDEQMLLMDLHGKLLSADIVAGDMQQAAKHGSVFMSASEAALPAHAPSLHAAKLTYAACAWEAGDAKHSVQIFRDVVPNMTLDDWEGLAAYISLFQLLQQFGPPVQTVNFFQRMADRCSDRATNEDQARTYVMTMVCQAKALLKLEQNDRVVENYRNAMGALRPELIGEERSVMARAGLLQELATVQFKIGDPMSGESSLDEALELSEQIAEHEDRIMLQREVLFALARHYSEIPLLPNLERAVGQLGPLVSDDMYSERLELISIITRGQEAGGAVEAAQATLAEGLEWARSIDSVRERLQAVVHIRINQGTLLYSNDGIAECRRIMDEVERECVNEADFERASYAYINYLNLKGWLFIHDDEYADALPFLTEAHDLTVNIAGGKDPLLCARLLYGIGLCRVQSDPTPEQGLERLQRSRQMMISLGFRISDSYLKVIRLMIEIYDGLGNESARDEMRRELAEVEPQLRSIRGG